MARNREKINQKADENPLLILPDFNKVFASVSDDSHNAGVRNRGFERVVAHGGLRVKAETGMHSHT